MGSVIHGRPLVAGEAEGDLMVTAEPLSFWGGYDQQTGEVIDRHHPLAGRVAAGRILALPGSRGSSTTTAVLLEAIQAGVAPAAFLVSLPDTYFALASIVSDALFGRSVPIVQLSPDDLERLADGSHVSIDQDGTVRLEGPSG
jgi:predicted aconitase with swiveling domain